MYRCDRYDGKFRNLVRTKHTPECVIWSSQVIPTASYRKQFRPDNRQPIQTGACKTSSDEEANTTLNCLTSGTTFATTNSRGDSYYCYI